MRSKSIDLFCASPASTAICSSMDHRSIHRPGLRPVDRPTPRRLGPRNEAPCLAQLPFDPSRPFYHNKSRKSASSATKQVNDHQTLRRKSSADVDDLANPLRSSGYLLSDKPYVDFILSDSERALVPSEPVRDRNNNNNNSNNDYKRLDSDGTLRAFRSLSTRSYESPVYKPSFANDGGANKNLPVKLSDHLSVHKSSSAPSNHQVVELRVSIHCKGCEGKLRKHISRMEGVTSFSIDLATKKVTVTGDVTPLSVLTSISRVKNAQFWPSPTSSSSSSSNSSSPSPRLSLAR